MPSVGHRQWPCMGDLVGRARESELLAALLDQAVSGRGRVVLIAGCCVVARRGNGVTD